MSGFYRYGFHLLSAVLLVITGHCLHAQGDLAHMPGTRYLVGGKDSVMIMQRPVTNREYVLYVMWTYCVYSENYPEEIHQLLPGYDPQRGDGGYSGETAGSGFFHTMCSACPTFVRHYIFNPVYADFPVLGLSHYQASGFLKWYSDRYNEYLLIRAGKLQEDPTQSSENCFVTESYLCGQYMGYVNRRDTVPARWNDRVLIPSFRLPTSSELALAAKSGVLKKEMAAYQHKKNEVLDVFGKYLLEVKNNQYILKTVNGFSETMESAGDFSLSDIRYTEMTLDVTPSDPPVSVMTVFAEMGQPEVALGDFVETEKDSLGRMPFLFMAENRLKRPVIIAPYLKPEDVQPDTLNLSFFRVSCSIRSDRVKIK